MAISNSAVLAGLLAKLPSFCFFLFHSASVSLRIFVYSNIIDFFFSANISSWRPNSSSQKAAGFFISTFGARLWNQAPQEGHCAGKCDVAGMHSHACLYWSEIDWLVGMSLAGWTLKLLTPFITLKNAVNFRTLAQTWETWWWWK